MLLMTDPCEGRHPGNLALTGAGTRSHYRPRRMCVFKSRKCPKWQRMKCIKGKGSTIDAMDCDEGEASGPTWPCLMTGVDLKRRDGVRNAGRSELQNQH